MRDTFELRQQKWGYDLAQKQLLEWVFERDNHDRILWNQAANRRSESPERVEMLARRAMDTDSTNLEMVTQILKETGRPQKYGTQWGMDGKLAPLLDDLRVNEWRQEVGLPPIEL